MNCPAPGAGEGGRAGQEKHEPGAAKQEDPGRLRSVTSGSSKQGDLPLLEVQTEELGKTQGEPHICRKFIQSSDKGVLFTYYVPGTSLGNRKKC